MNPFQTSEELGVRNEELWNKFACGKFLLLYQIVLI